MNACVIIPARFKSTRLPGKPLLELLGKPMIIWVAEIASRAVGINNVYIATDDKRIASLVNQSGFKYIMTSTLALTGTDRVAEAANKLNYETIVNVQGDEPLISHEDVIECIKYKNKYPKAVINAYNKIQDIQNPINLNIPKVIINEADYLVYMSRSLIPGFKDIHNKPIEYKKQVCIYGYNQKELRQFLEFGRKSKLEEVEDIEILRFLEFGSPIKMFKAKKDSLAVDVKEDIALVEQELKTE